MFESVGALLIRLRRRLIPQPLLLTPDQLTRLVEDAIGLPPGTVPGFQNGLLQPAR